MRAQQHEQAPAAITWYGWFWCWNSKKDESERRCYYFKYKLHRYDCIL